MIAILTPPRQVGEGREAGKLLEIVDEMRLVEAAAGERDVCPGDQLTLFDHAQRFLKTKDATKALWREPNLLTE